MKTIPEKKAAASRTIKPPFIVLAFALFLFPAGLYAQDGKGSPAKTGIPAASEMLKTADETPDLREAASMLEQALPGTTDKDLRYEILSRLGLLYEILGDAESAQRSYELAAFIRDGENDFTLFYRSALLLLEIGETSRAEMQGKMVWSASPDSSLRVKAGILLLSAYARLKKNKEFETVLRELTILREKADFSSGELFGLFEALSLIGRKDEAEAEKKRILEKYPDSLEAKLLGRNGQEGPVFLFSTPFRLWGMQPVDVLPEAALPGPEAKDLESAAQKPAVSEPAVQKPAAQKPAAQKPAAVLSQEPEIQTGLFSQEKNARHMIESLKAKGFDPLCRAVTQAGKEYFKVVVTIPPGEQRQETILKLKDAGFEAF